MLGKTIYLLGNQKGGYIYLIIYLNRLTYSGSPSKRINLSPFTKDFRGGEHIDESYGICCGQLANN